MSNTFSLYLSFLFTKLTLYPQMPSGPNAESLLCEDPALAAEVSGDMVAQTFMDGLADGTLLLSDLDSTPFEDGE